MTDDHKLGKDEGFRFGRRMNQPRLEVDWYYCEKCDSDFSLNDDKEAYYCPHCGCKEIVE